MIDPLTAGMLVVALAGIAVAVVVIAIVVRRARR